MKKKGNYKNFAKFAKALLLSSILLGGGVRNVRAEAAHEAPQEAAQVIEVAIPSARTKTVTGFVYDETGVGIPGSTITIKGSSRGVVTDLDGSFKIDVSPTDVLEVSFLGYDTYSVTVGDKASFVIPLKPKSNELDEVTIVAFGKQRKESMVASITTVNVKDLKVPSSNLTTALAGRMAGLISYQRSGEPGADNADFFIRGVTTFGYKKDPLILIDNNESTTTELSRMNTDDIESFSILKDAAATALYGARGANGVILIKTKEGKEGKAKVNIRLEQSYSMPTRMVELADPVTYMRLNNEAVSTRNALEPTPYSQSKIDHTAAGDNPYVYPATDWYGALFRDIAQNQRLNFSVSGGGNIARYYLAGNIINENGILNVDERQNFNSNINLKRYMLRSNVNINITPTTEAIVRMSGAFDNYTGPIESGTDMFKVVMHTNPVLFAPYYPADKANKNTQHILFGNYGNSVSYNNPYAMLMRGYKDYTSSQLGVQFEINQDLNFILKGLSLRGLYNTNRYSFFDVTRAYKPYYYNIGSYDKNTDTYVLAPLNENSGQEELGYTPGDTEANATTYFESALNWVGELDEKNTVNMMLVYTMRDELVANADDLQKSLPYRNIGFAGRATYDYDHRYLAEFNFGYNASERFSAKERWGFFPSGGVGWVVSNEGFWSDEIKNVVSNLKIKATYGLVGNDAIGDANDRFFYLSNVVMHNRKFSDFGTYGRPTDKDGISITRYANDGITWETARKKNFTVELGLFGKLDIQAEYFDEFRYNILMDRSSIPSTMGLQAALRANVGEASTMGTDIAVNLSHSFNANAWITGMANFTYATSKFEVYEEPVYSNAPWHSRVGYSLNQKQGYIAERLFADEEEVRNSPTQFGGDYRAGDIKYKDLNNDGKITELDMAPIGYPTSPEIVYGFGLSGGWKQFDLSFFFQGLARESFWIDYEETHPFLNQQNALLKAYANDHWSEDNRNLYALWPRLSGTVIENNKYESTWFMRNGAFLRLKQVEFGYTFSGKILSRLKLSSLRPYFSGTNLLTFSQFKLWDPEMGGNGLGYPLQKVYNIGLQLNF